MAIKGNKLTAILGLLAIAVFGGVAYLVTKQPSAVEAAAPMKEVPRPPAASGSAPQKDAGLLAPRTPQADADRPNETLSTLVARANENDRKLAELNNRLEAALQERARQPQLTEEQIAAKVAARINASKAAEAVSAAPAAPPSPDATPNMATGISDTLGSLAKQGGQALESATAGRRAGSAAPTRNTPQGVPKGLGFDDADLAAQGITPAAAQRAAGYTIVGPMGHPEEKDRNGKMRLVMTKASVGEPDEATTSRSDGNTRNVATPYFTIPENGTMTRVTAMTAIVGRVPIDGKVQDPMKFKAIIGRENLAANGFEVPDDVAGIVVSGIAIGDMALQCSEGYVHSLTFVFDDGAIRTVSSRAAGSGSPRDKALGYVTDLYGNPCISGTFVTNAPRYLTDIILSRGASIGARAYAAAQTTTTDSGVTGNSSTSVTGSRGAFVLGQAAAGGVDEVTHWLTSRLKNSFDAVVTRAGQKVVLHIEQEIAIDKPDQPRRLDHTATLQQRHTGDHHGLD